MKIALAVWNGRISPLFDSAREIVIVDIENNVLKNKQNMSLESQMPFHRARELINLNIEVLICGAISHLYASMIESQNIRIISFIAGDTEQIIDSYIHGELHKQEFKMPGCHKRRRKRCRKEY